MTSETATRNGRRVRRAAVAGSSVAAFLHDVCLPIAATRALLAAVGILSIAALPVSPWVPSAWLRLSGNPLVDAFSRWDSLHYIDIAANGYPATDPASAAFFPFYPVLVRATGALVGAAGVPELRVIGLIVSNAMLVAAVAALIALCRLDHDGSVVSRAVWYLLVFPTSLFLSAAYAESTFLALSIGAVLASRRDRWLLAGFLGALAALTRPYGFLVAVPIAMEAFGRWREGARPWRALLAVPMVAGGLVSYMAFLGVRYGDPLAFLHAESGWHRSIAPPWQAFINTLSGPITANGSHSAVDLVFAIATIAVVVAAWKLLRPSYALYLTALVLVPLSTGSLGSLSRFDVSFFPIFIVLAIAGRVRAFDRAYMVAAMGLGAVFMALFAQWYWVA